MSSSVLETNRPHRYAMYRAMSPTRWAAHVHELRVFTTQRYSQPAGSSPAVVLKVKHQRHPAARVWIRLLRCGFLPVKAHFSPPVNLQDPLSLQTPPSSYCCLVARRHQPISAKLRSCAGSASKFHSYFPVKLLIFKVAPPGAELHLQPVFSP